MLLIAGIVHLQQELVIGSSVNHQNHLHSHCSRVYTVAEEIKLVEHF